MTTYQLTTLHLGSECVAVVPARALSWHRVQLPAGTLRASHPRLRAVLEGLLEDQLLDEPAQLHFALQPGAHSQAPVWVAVCDRGWLTQSLAHLQSLGQTPQRVVPEWAPASAATPQDAPAATLWVTGVDDAPELVWTDSQGVHILPISRSQGLPAHLPVALARDAELLAEPAVAQLAEDLLHRPARVMGTTERLDIAAGSDWDLAQFELAPRNPVWARLTHAAGSFRQAPRWRAARWALGALLLVQVLGLNLTAWHAQAQLAQQRADMRSTLLDTFPQTTVVVDAPLQMARGLDNLRQSSGGTSARDLEALLGAYESVAAAAHAHPSPVAIDFVAGELRLGGLGRDAAGAAALDAGLRTHGFASRVEGDTLVVQARSTP